MGTICSGKDKRNQASVKLITQIQNNLKKQSFSYAEEEYQNFVIKFWEDSIPKGAVKNKRITMGEPFIEYEPDREKEQLFYIHYPVFLKRKTFGIFTVTTNADKEMTVQLSEPSMPSGEEKMLDIMDYQSENIIFYKKGNQIIAESRKKQWKYTETLDSSHISEKEQAFAEKSWEEKAKEIRDNTRKLVKYEFPDFEDSNANSLESIPPKMTEALKEKKRQKEKRQIYKKGIVVAGGAILGVGVVVATIFCFKKRKQI